MDLLIRKNIENPNKTRMENKRIYFLDLIKFIAAITIALYHYGQRFNSEFIFDMRIDLVVELFFFISGFIEHTKASEERIHNFIINKIIRIFPMVIISTTFAYVTCCLFNLTNTSWIEDTTSFFIYICNCLLLFQNGIFNLNFFGVNNPIWYLSALFVIYIIYYLIEIVSKKTNTNKIYWYILLIVMYIYIGTNNLGYPLFNSKLVGIIPFFVGCIVSSYNKNHQGPVISIVSLSCLVLILICCCYANINVLLNMRYLFTFIICPLFILFGLNSNFIKKITQHKIIGELGKISFEIYLWHTPIYRIFYLIFSSTSSLNPNSAVVMTICIIIMLIWTILMFYFVEKPISRKLNSIKIINRA